MSREFVRIIGLRIALIALVTTGCAHRDQTLVEGEVTTISPSKIADIHASAAIVPSAPAIPERFGNTAPQEIQQASAQTKTFDLPTNIPGANTPPIQPPRFDANATAAERIATIAKAYPKLPTPVEDVKLEGKPLNLSEMQQIAIANNPAVRKAQSNADAAIGPVIQAGLYPNPTVGWQADQWMPGNKPSNNSGQQGFYVNQLIKTAGKLSLAQAVAGFEYMNAMIAIRKAEVELRNQVRTHYFGVLIARQSVEINRSLVQIADEVYQLQLKQLAAGEAAGYEPLQLYSQAIQARNALINAQANETAAWRQLAIAMNQPDLPMGPLDGKADVNCPEYLYEELKSRLIEQHTDMLTARNSLQQAQANLRLQTKLPIPDIVTNTVVQHDNSSGNNQFNLQIGVALPLFDRNQGNIHQARGQIATATNAIAMTQNELSTKLADAFGRYQSQRTVASNMKNEVIPNLTRAYRAIVRRYQVEPEKVSFNDVVVAQQNIAQALQAYLTSLDAQWKAVVDLANTAQLDDLYPARADREEKPTAK